MDKNKSILNLASIIILDVFYTTLGKAKILTILTWQQLRKMLQGLLKQLTANFTEVTLSINTKTQTSNLPFQMIWNSLPELVLFFFTKHHEETTKIQSNINFQCKITMKY